MDGLIQFKNLSLLEHALEIGTCSRRRCISEAIVHFDYFATPDASFWRPIPFQERLQRLQVRLQTDGRLDPLRRLGGGQGVFPLGV
jgi:hypothetical protein